MGDPERNRTTSQLVPAYGLVVGAVIGLLLGALDVIPVVWGLLVGAALGLVAGAAVSALSARR